MEMYGGTTIEDVRRTAEAMLAQSDVLSQMANLELPGRFVFSPPDSSRLCVGTLEELHTARAVLRDHFGWKDRIGNKFFSCGVVIATYIPDGDVKTPLPFELWIEAPPESFPNMILGDCTLKRVDGETAYVVTCPVG